MSSLIKLTQSVALSSISEGFRVPISILTLKECQKVDTSHKVGFLNDPLPRITRQETWMENRWLMLRSEEEREDNDEV